MTKRMTTLVHPPGVWRHRGRGFSLIELLVVMAVLGILAAATIPLAEITLQRERERELRRSLWEIRDAIDAYRRTATAGGAGGPATRSPGASGYPPALDALTLGIPDPQRPGSMLTFLRRVPRDPFAPAGLPAAQTWGLRSYQSPADNPQAGPDVYDVYSRSTAIGLNGVPLKDW